MVARRRAAAWRRGVAALALGLSALLGWSALSLTSEAASAPWSALQPIPGLASEHGVIWQLAGDPANPQTLAAATSSGVWMSFDGGQIWTRTAVHGLTWAVAFSASGNTIYAGTSSRGVYRSPDGGQSWRAQNAGLRSLDVRAISVGPTAVVLGTGAGVYYSGNGTGWAAAGLSGMSVSAVAIVADDPLGVVAGSDQTAQRDNLYISLSVSSSGGWQALPGGDPGGAPVFAIAAGPVAKGASGPPLLVGNLRGLYSSSDQGQSWQSLNLAGGAIWAVTTIAFDPENPAVAYVGGDNGGSSGGGLQRSVDGGSAWSVYEQGLPATDVASLDVLPTNPLTVLAATWDAQARTPASARALDPAAPPPVALRASTGTPISVSVSPTPTAHPSAPPRHHSDRSLEFPVWLVAVVVVALVLALSLLVLWRRRRRRRLEAEAPP